MQWDKRRYITKIRGLLRCLKTNFWLCCFVPGGSSHYLIYRVIASSLELLAGLLLSWNYGSYFFPSLKCLRVSTSYTDVLSTSRASSRSPFFEVFFDHSQSSQIPPSLNLDGIIRHLNNFPSIKYFCVIP